MSLESLAERSAEFFSRCFGKPPRWVVAAPGRVNLIGEHTDYNDGWVLPMAIERFTVLAADRRPDPEMTIHSLTTGETAGFGVKNLVTRGTPAWSNYLRGVVAGFQQLGRKIPGLQVVIASSVPFGAGLSSSAALEVAMATLLETIGGAALEPIAKALLCQRAEHKFANVPCGLMDQITSILAKPEHALLIDCRSRAIEPVALGGSEVTVLLINTEVRHRLMDGEYALRRNQCDEAAKTLKTASLREATTGMLKAAQKKMEPVNFRRARHVVTENGRVLEACKALRAGDWPAMGQLMYASHESLRGDYEVSCKELDAVVEIARQIGENGGVYGCRMTGGGFGGCAVALVRTDAVAAITHLVNAAYEQRTGISPTIFASRPVGGSRVLKG